MTSILDILQSAGFSPCRVSGEEWSSPCPKCGGKDRFRIWSERNRWYCRGCGTGGDLVEYYHVIEGVPHADRPGMPGAFTLAGKQNDRRPVSATKPLPKEWMPKPSAKPGDLWQEKAAALIKWAHAQLMENRAVLDWLKTERGISEETARHAQLGWNPTDLYRERPSWGLSDERNEQGKSRCIFIPAGLVIPCRSSSGDLLRVKIRRSDPGDGPRYIFVAGGSTDPAIWGSESTAVVIVESELDAVIIEQDAGGVACAVALGSAAIRPDESLTALLRSSANVLVSLDSDEAGAKAAWGWWKKNFPTARRWPVPAQLGKDPTEARKNGLPLHEWIQAAISPATPPVDPTPETTCTNPHTEPTTPTASGSLSADLPELVNERAAIREIDGNTTRAAAIRAAILEYHPDGRCYRCRGRNWWASVHGPIICERCHEPISEAIVELRVSFDEADQEKAA